MDDRTSDPRAETYTKRSTPLLVSPHLEAHSGAMFDRKGLAILPSSKMTDSSSVRVYIDASEAVAARASVRLSS